MSEQVQIRWSIVQDHEITLPREQWVAMVQSEYGNKVDATDDDAVYALLEKGDWRADDLLIELASALTWVDTKDAEISDLTAVSL